MNNFLGVSANLWYFFDFVELAEFEDVIFYAKI
jgi:hypothetical protein